MDARDHAKELAAQRALEFINDGMIVGLGSGSTARHFIRLLGARVQTGLKIRGIPSSKNSETLAKSLAIPIIDFHQTSLIDASKIVEPLGKFPLPVEVIPMAAPLVAAKLSALKIRAQVRQQSSGGDYI